jgi:hypothetical protein
VVVEYVPTSAPERIALVNELVRNHPVDTFCHEYVVVFAIAPST